MFLPQLQCVLVTEVNNLTQEKCLGPLKAIDSQNSRFISCLKDDATRSTWPSTSTALGPWFYTGS